MKYYLIAPAKTFHSSDNLLTYSSETLLKIGQIVEIPLGRQSTIGIVVKNTTQQNNNKNINITKSEQKQVVKKEPKINSFIWPIKGNVISSFGSKSNGLYNDGINISAPKGTDFRACEDGRY